MNRTTKTVIINNLVELLVELKKRAGKILPAQMRMTGLEPAHLAASEPKSDVSANSTTSAYLINSRKNLNLARLPIPPQAQIIKKEDLLSSFFMSHRGLEPRTT